MVRFFKDWFWLRKIRHQYAVGVGLLNRCEPGSDEEYRMTVKLGRLKEIIDEAAMQLRTAGRIGPTQLGSSQ